MKPLTMGSVDYQRRLWGRSPCMHTHTPRSLGHKGAVHLVHTQRANELQKLPKRCRRLAGRCRATAEDEVVQKKRPQSIVFPEPSPRSSSGPVWQGGLEAGQELAEGKYKVVEVLGRGSNGTTYLAETREGKRVAVKVLSLKTMSDWKQLELFEREAQTLESLRHPGIPAYLDYFEEDTDTDRAFCLVQEVARGESLASMVARGWRADEAEVERIGAELLRVLGYLGGRRPPVVHRDIKPENVVIEGGRTGGRVYLVDFGGMQAAAAGADGRPGTTIVGTYGYMAPEQFRGAAQPASDAYAVGGTLLAVLSGKPPSSFPQEGLRTVWRGEVAVGPRLGAVLEGLLEPAAEDRLTAQEALDLLTGQAPVTLGSRGGGQGITRGQPAGGRAVVKLRGSTLEVDIPAARALTGAAVGNTAFAVAWNGFVGFWTAGALAGGGLLFAAFSLPFWAVGFSLARNALYSSFVTERLEISRKAWRLGRSLPFAPISRQLADPDRACSMEDSEGGQREGRRDAAGRSPDLREARVVTSVIVNGEPQTHIELLEGVRKHVFGEGLDTFEQQWLADEINAHIARLNGGSGGSGSGPLRKGLPREIEIEFEHPDGGGRVAGQRWGQRRREIEREEADERARAEDDIGFYS